MMGSYFCVATSEEGEERQETFVFPTDENAPEPSGDGAQDYVSCTLLASALRCLRPYLKQLTLAEVA